MKKKLWAFILLPALTIIIITIIFANDRKQEAGITTSYSDKTGQIMVYAIRPSNKNESYKYENRSGGKEIVSLSNSYSENSSDVFVFNILGNGSAELVFFSIEPQTDDKYRYAYGLEIAVMDGAVSLNNKLWKR